MPSPSDEDNGHKLNYDLMDSANSSGKIFISHTVCDMQVLPDVWLWNILLTDNAYCLFTPFLLDQVLSGKFVLRFVVGAPLTEEHHVIAAWKLLQDEAAKLLGNL